MANSSGFDPAAFFIGGGAEHSPEVVRNMLYSATMGAEGVTSPGDWKASQLDVPAGQVRIAPGSGLILNRHIGDDPDETYSARAAVESFLDVRSTGSSGGRSDLVVVRVEDPQYEGWPDPPTEEAARNWEYTKPVIIENVPASTTRAEERDLGYAAYAVARIDIPANTGTITNAMIKDLRRLHSPRTWNDRRVTQPAALQSIHDGSWFRAGNFSPTFPTPPWATHVTVSALLTSVEHSEGQAVGDMRISFGGALFGALTIYDIEGVAVDRQVLATSAEFEIPANLRGTQTQAGVDLRRNTAPAFPGHITILPASTIQIDVQFQERAV